MNNSEINWEETRNNAAISFMSSIIEKTQHPVLVTDSVKDAYAAAAVQYADALIQHLFRNPSKIPVKRIPKYGEPVI